MIRRASALSRVPRKPRRRCYRDRRRRGGAARDPSRSCARPPRSRRSRACSSRSRVEAADDARLADRDVETPQPGVVHDDVGHARQRQALDEHRRCPRRGRRARHRRRRRRDGRESSQSPCGPSLATSNTPSIVGPLAVDHARSGRLADVRVDAIALARRTRAQRGRPGSASSAIICIDLEFDDGCGAVLAERLAEVEGCKAAADRGRRRARSDAGLPRPGRAAARPSSERR